ncbi:MAG: phosphatidate cytidylyltransferase [Deltaproteobacteria bacterium]|nr:phosphatidate cytidylyltransferase [Deltaproteobacteria bacterium]
MQFLQDRQNLAIAIGAVLAILVLATGIYLLLKQLKPNKGLPEIGMRIRSWWIMVVVFSGVITFSQNLSLVFISFLSFLALKEYLAITPTRHADRKILFWAYLSIPIQFYWIWTGWYWMFIIFIPVYAFLFLPMRMVMIGETRGFLKAAGTLNWGIMTTVFSLSHMAYLLVLPLSGNPAAGGVGLLFFLVVLTQLNDVAQFLFGKMFGRHKITPTVSPNKTWGGVIGGIFSTTLVSWLAAPLLTPFTATQAIAVGIIIALAGFTGDVVISAIKRDLQIKDTGTLIPGHGGILDRIDSLTYTAPLFFHIVVYFHF